MAELCFDFNNSVLSSLVIGMQLLLFLPCSPSIPRFILISFPSPQVDQFFDKGYVVMPSFFTMEEMQPAIKAVEECVDILANRLYRAGRRGWDGWMG